MTHFNEHSLEMAIMQLFQAEGYTYTSGETIHKEQHEVVLLDDLSAFLTSQYADDGITAMEVSRAIGVLTANNGGALYEQSAQTWRLMTEGFALQRDDASQHPIWIEPICFAKPEKNVLRIVNQLEIRGPKEKRIPDGIVYVNGLPVVVLEFKSAVKEETTIKDAWTQLTVRYKRDIPDLFRYNAFCVISDGVNSKYGSLFTPYDFFYAWNKVDDGDEAIDGIGSLMTMVKGLFRPQRLMAVMKDFVFLPDQSKHELKIVCRYPQYFAATKLFDSVLKHSHGQAGGDGKGGTYFGATGCGKSYTMLFLTRMLMRSKQMQSPTIVLITDRTDLDAQLSQLFGTAKQFIGDQLVKEVGSRQELRECLQGRKSGGVFLTTIHKFTEDTQLLSDRSNIVCISDEAHRSQTNLDEHLIIDEKGVRRRFGFAKHLHDSLPRATYVGFTGTPVDQTLVVFGPIVDQYTMRQSVADGITRKIVYEGRAAKVTLDSEKLQLIEDYYNQCAEDGANEYQIDESKRAVANMNVILADPKRLEAVAKDLVKHYENRIEEGSTVEGKAMIVCSNREIAYKLYKQIENLRPEWTALPRQKVLSVDWGSAVNMAAEDQPEPYGEKQTPIERMRLVMTRSKDDEQELYDLLGNDEYREQLAIQFKNPHSNFKIAIVVDMWITGFDVPCLDTMYIDKPLQQHTLIQTISRVNRVYPGKEMGLIVDYLGIKNKLNTALKQYGGQGSNEEDDTVKTVEQSVTIVKDELDFLRRMFRNFNYDKFFHGMPMEQLKCLNEAAEYVQTTQEKEHDFMAHVRRMKMAYNLCSNSDELSKTERDEIHFFCAVRSVVYKLTHGDAPDATQMNKRVSEMISDAIQSEGVEEMIKLGENGTNIDLLSEDYMERLQTLTFVNTKVKLMERLLNTVIGNFQKVNKIKAVEFSKRLKEIVDKYNDRSDNIALARDVLDEVANQMAQLLKQLNKEKKSFGDIGITYEEKAFFDILKSIAEKFNFIDKFPDERLIEMSKEVKAIVDDKSQYTDWAVREDIKAELKVALIITLDKYGYPPVYYDEVYKEVFEQAENFKKHVNN